MDDNKKEELIQSLLKPLPIYDNSITSLMSYLQPIKAGLNQSWDFTKNMKTLNTNVDESTIKLDQSALQTLIDNPIKPKVVEEKKPTQQPVKVNSIYTPRTQKAKGLQHLCKLSIADKVDIKHLLISVDNPTYFARLEYDGLYYTMPLDKTIYSYISSKFDNEGKFFLRPCPTIPRHGFIESISVSGPNLIEEIKKLAEIVYKEDSLGEIIVMPYIESAYNMLFAEQTITIGKGNDGATAGKDTLVINVAPINIDSDLLHKAGVSVAPYIELVQTKQMRKLILTQLRDGVKVKTKDTLRWIPNDIPLNYTYVHAVNNSVSLMDWEKTVSRLHPAKHIVWIRGGSLTCHYAVHAITNGLTVVCDMSLPSDGTILQKNIDSGSNPVGDIRFLEFREGVIRALNDVNIWPNNVKDIVWTSLYFLHNSPFIDLDTPLNSYLFGWSMGWTARLGLTACAGEFRHAGIIDFDAKKVHTKSHKQARDTIYKKYLSKPFSIKESHIKKMWEVFGLSWYESSYGGIMWQSCLESALSLWNTVTLIAKGGLPNRSKIQIIPALNNLINSCHNGAPLLSKFIHSASFDVAAKQPYTAALNAAPILYETWKGKTDEKTSDKAIKVFGIN
jgi:hypothetical protein